MFEDYVNGPVAVHNRNVGWPHIINRLSAGHVSTGGCEEEDKISVGCDSADIFRTSKFLPSFFKFCERTWCTKVCAVKFYCNYSLYFFYMSFYQIIILIFLIDCFVN